MKNKRQLTSNELRQVTGGTYVLICAICLRCNCEFQPKDKNNIVCPWCKNKCCDLIYAKSF